MSTPDHSPPDAAILNEIRELAGSISDERTQAILESVIDAVALNPQPLPPKTHKLLRSVIDAVALNPQPLPPEPPPEAGGASVG